MKQLIVTKKIVELNIDFYIRSRVDDSRVLLFAELMERGVVFPPITIDISGGVLDGRTRIAACDFIGVETIECVVEDIKDDLNRVFRAFELNNPTGSKPPSRDDVAHIFRILINKNEPRKNILNGMSVYYPKSFLEKVYKDVQSHIIKERVNKAIKDIGEGKSIEEVAVLNCVSVLQIKRRLASMASNNGPKVDVAHIKSNVTLAVRAASNGLRRQFNDIQNSHQAGDIPQDTVVEVIDLAHKLLRNLDHTVRNWRNRFEKIE